MTDAKVAEAAARQAAHHEAVESKVSSGVNAEIASQATVGNATDHARVEAVAAHVRDRAIDDAEHGERVVDRARTAARGSQFIDYGFSVIYALLGIRLVLALIAANSTSGFVRLIRTVTDPFYAPFRGIVPSPTVDGGYTLVLPIIVALVVYLILHLAINGLLRMVGHRKTTV